jgi:hypothetical protein
MTSNNWFTNARYGLYSLLERGEWLCNFHGQMTEEGSSLCWLLRRSPDDTATLGGLRTPKASNKNPKN